MKNNLKLVALALLLFSCSSQDQTLQQDDIDVLYAQSIADAARELNEEDIYDSLLPIVYGGSDMLEWRIDGADTMVLVSSLQAADWFAEVSENEVFESSDDVYSVIWVAVPAQVGGYLKESADLADSTAVNLRLKQILGLKPDDDASVIYKFWVNRNDLLRPSYINDITTNVGAVEYAETTEPEWFRSWLDDNIAYSYESPEDGLNYPFTRLGYTYDWGGDSKFGPSEYIIVPSSSLIMHEKIGCWSYYQQL